MPTNETLNDLARAVADLGQLVSKLERAGSRIDTGHIRRRHTTLATELAALRRDSATDHAEMNRRFGAVQEELSAVRRSLPPLQRQATLVGNNNPVDSELPGLFKTVSKSFEKAGRTVGKELRAGSRETTTALQRLNENLESSGKQQHYVTLFGIAVTSICSLLSGVVGAWAGHYYAHVERANECEEAIVAPDATPTIPEDAGLTRVSFPDAPRRPPAVPRSAAVPRESTSPPDPPATRRRRADPCRGIDDPFEDLGGPCCLSQPNCRAAYEEALAEDEEYERFCAESPLHEDCN